MDLDLSDYGDVLASRSKLVKERETCEDSLVEFIQKGWRHIDPARFINSWHLEAIAEHLQAVTDGHIRRLCINIPPRTSKSSMVSVAWPAWTWVQRERGPLSGPQVQFLSASYAHTLSLRDSVKTRRLIQSKWYQELWGDRFKLVGDQNEKQRFHNSAGGQRLATSVDGYLTGEGGDIIIVDDPHKAGRDAESETVRVNTLQWWDEVMSTRLNDARVGAFVIVMQRLHMEDLSGHVLGKSGWTHLCLPMEYESSRHCVTFLGGEKFWEDPRTEEGELLCLERFPPDVVTTLKEELATTYAIAGQLQQRPVPRGGGIIKDEWWKHWTDIKYPQCEFVVASLDTAYTERQEGDLSCLSVWGVFRSDPTNAIPLELARKGPDVIEQWYLNQTSKVILLYQWQARLNLSALVKRVMETCTLTVSPTVKEKVRFKIDRLLIEKAAAGFSVAQELTRLLGFSNDFGVELIEPRKMGDKIARLTSVEHLFENGRIYVPWPIKEDGTEQPYGYKWVEDAIDQVGAFPRTRHDDFVDSASMALRWLRDSGILQRPEEHAKTVREDMAYTPSPLPLYPV